MNEADAICREMGYLRARTWTSGHKWEIQNTFGILLDDVQCQDDKDWISCSFRFDHDCAHSDDVFLECDGSSKLPMHLDSLELLCISV